MMPNDKAIGVPIIQAWCRRAFHNQLRDFALLMGSLAQDGGRPSLCDYQMLNGIGYRVHNGPEV